MSDLELASRTVPTTRMRRSFLVAAVVTCFAGFITSALGQEFATHPVSGVVLDRVTLHPIPQVKVKANGIETSTDQEGKFQLALPAGMVSSRSTVKAAGLRAAHESTASASAKTRLSLSSISLRYRQLPSMPCTQPWPLLDKRRARTGICELHYSRWI